MNSMLQKTVQLVLKHQLLIFFIFVLGFRLFYASQIVTFTQDQARDVLLMEQFRDEGKVFISYGPKASVGNFYLAPFYYQLHYTLSFLTGNHPLTMHFFITIVESFTPVILFLILKNFTRKKYAYLISLLYVFSPLVTIFATFSWNPNLIPFLSLSALFLAIRYFEVKKGMLLIWFSVALVLAVHLHYQAIVLLPFYLYVMVRSIIEDSKAIKYWLIGLCVSLLTIMPYLLSEYNTNWINTRQIFDYFFNEHSRYYDRVSKPAFVVTFIPSFLERVVIGKNYVLDKIIIGRFIFFLGLIVFILKALKNKKTRIALIYFIGIIVMLRVYKGDKLDYYMSTLFSFPFFLLAFISDTIKKMTIPLLLLLAFFIGQTYQDIQPKNQLLDLQSAITFLRTSTPTNTVNFHFHDDNYINIFAYGLNRYSTIVQDKTSKTIIDICYGKEQTCEWDQIMWCKHDRGYTYMALFNTDSKYRFLSKNERNQGYNIIIGEVETLPSINYQISTYQHEYGDDFLIKGL